MRGLKHKSALEFLRLVKVSLESGRDWRDALLLASKAPKNKELRQWSLDIRRRLETSSSRELLKHEANASRSNVNSRLFDLLLRLEAGLPRPVERCEELYHQLLSESYLKAQLENLMFIPKAQALVGLSTSGLLVLLTPFLFPRLMPSFVQIGRWDLALLGGLALLFSVALVFWISSWPSRKLQRLRLWNQYFSDLGWLVSAGSDFRSAWNLAKSPLPELNQEFEDHRHFLDQFQELHEKSPSPWSSYIQPLVWKAESGVGLVAFLKSCVNEANNELSQKWEAEAKKASFLALLPLVFMMMPANLFLVLGPQFILMQGRMVFA